jgi:hypothetical protein
MHKLSCFVAAAAISGFALAATPASAGPLASGVMTGVANAAALDEGLVHKVHRWHCRKRYGWFRGDKRWHRHWRACDDDYGYYHPGYHYGYPGYGFGVPFFSFSFYDDDDGHRRKHRHYRKYKRKHKGY